MAPLITYGAFLLLATGMFFATGAMMRYWEDRRGSTLVLRPGAVGPARPRRWAPAVPEVANFGVSRAVVALFVLVSAFTAGPYILRPCEGGPCNLGAMLRAGQQDIRMLDRNGRLIGAGRGYRRVEIDELPSYVPALAIAVEDRRFRWHPCVDPIGMARAVVSNLRGRREGASTLCMQVVRALDRQGRIRPDGTWGGKVAETWLAVRLYARLGFSKEKILEEYLNQVYFGTSTGGHAIRGIEHAAWAFFGKSAVQLSLGEAAALIGMIQSPARYDPRTHPQAARERRELVLRQLVAYEASYRPLAQTESAVPVRVQPAVPPRAKLAMELAAYLPENGGDTLLATTLDLGAQDSVLVILRRLEARVRAGAFGRYLPPRRGGNGIQTIGIGMDGATGAIRAYSCGTVDQASLGAWDLCRTGHITLASTLKIWLMMEALEDRSVRVDETLAALAARAGNPHLRSAYTRQFCTTGVLRLTVRAAFVHSNNCLAILLLTSMSNRGVSHLQLMGVNVNRDRLPTALGTDTISPLLLVAYVAAIGNGGRVPTPHFADRVPAVVPPLPELGMRRETLLTLRTLMEDVVEHGTARRAADELRGRGAYAKTGTFQNVDVRVVGGLRDRGTVALVWLGRRDPEPLLVDMDAGRLLASSWARVLLASAD